MLVDTHSHLNFKEFDGDREEIIKNCLEKNIWVFNVGTNYESSRKAVEIAENYPQGVYAVIGLHPLDVSEEVGKGIFDKKKYCQLAKSKKVIAIGEIGLDYPCQNEVIEEKQKEIFKEQLELAQELNLPIIIHCRRAHNELLKILELYVTHYTLHGVIHCFSGHWSQAERYLKIGFYLGFNGIIYKLNLDKIIEKTPLDRILIETDCPFLTPPLSSESPTKTKADIILPRNESQNVEYIARRIARTKGVSFQEISEITSANAKKLFLKTINDKR